MTDEPDEQGTVSFNLAPPERSARFDSLEDVFPSGDGAGPGDEAAADLPTFTTLDDVVHWANQAIQRANDAARQAVIAERLRVDAILKREGERERERECERCAAASPSSPPSADAVLLQDLAAALGEAEDLRAEVERLQQALAQAPASQGSGEAQATARELERLHREMTALAVLREAADERAAGTQAELEATRTTLRTQQQNNARAAAEIKKTRSRVKELEEKVEELTTAKDELQKELRGARKQLKDLNEAKADLEQRCEAVVLEKRDAERQRERMLAAEQTLRQENLTMRKELEHLRGDVRTQAERLSSLESLLHRATTMSQARAIYDSARARAPQQPHQPSQASDSLHLSPTASAAPAASAAPVNATGGDSAAPKASRGTSAGSGNRAPSDAPTVDVAGANAEGGDGDAEADRGSGWPSDPLTLDRPAPSVSPSAPRPSGASPPIILDAVTLTTSAPKSTFLRRSKTGGPRKDRGAAEVARDKADDDALSLVKRSGPMRRVGKLQEMLRRSEAARMELERDIMQGEDELSALLASPTLVSRFTGVTALPTPSPSASALSPSQRTDRADSLLEPTPSYSPGKSSVGQAGVTSAGPGPLSLSRSSTLPAVAAERSGRSVGAGPAAGSGRLRRGESLSVKVDSGASSHCDRVSPRMPSDGVPRMAPATVYRRPGSARNNARPTTPRSGTSSLRASADPPTGSVGLALIQSLLMEAAPEFRIDSLRQMPAPSPPPGPWPLSLSPAVDPPRGSNVGATLRKSSSRRAGAAPPAPAPDLARVSPMEKVSWLESKTSLSSRTLWG